MRLVHEPARAAPRRWRRARREAASSFGDDTLFLERFVHRPRHIEVQVLADAARHGRCTSASASAACSAGTRRSSRRRRRRCSTPAQRARYGALAVATAQAVGYTGAGTVEFIVAGRRRRRAVLHGDEHPAAGRAPGHRAGHRAGPRRAAAAGRRGRAAGASRRTTSAHRPRGRGAGVRRGPGARLPADRRHRRCWCASPRATACGSTARCSRAATSARRTTRCSARSSPGVRTGRRRWPGSTGRWPARRARRRHQHRLPAARCSRTPTCAPGALDTGLVERELEALVARAARCPTTCSSPSRSPGCSTAADRRRPVGRAGRLARRAGPRRPPGPCSAPGGEPLRVAVTGARPAALVQVRRGRSRAGPGRPHRRRPAADRRTAGRRRCSSPATARPPGCTWTARRTR